MATAITELKNTLDCTQIELSQRLGVAQSTISRLMRGQKPSGPVSKLIEQLASTARAKSAITTIVTEDGTWLARCPRTGLTASGTSLDEALAELRRLLASSEAA